MLLSILLMNNKAQAIFDELNDSPGYVYGEVIKNYSNFVTNTSEPYNSIITREISKIHYSLLR